MDWLRLRPMACSIRRDWKRCAPTLEYRSWPRGATAASDLSFAVGRNKFRSMSPTFSVLVCDWRRALTICDRGNSKLLPSGEDAYWEKARRTISWFPCWVGFMPEIPNGLARV